MNKINLIILVIIAIIIFAIGGGLGILYQAQKDDPRVLALDMLRSEVVPSIVAYGELAKIDGQNLTLTYQGDSVVIKIANNAKVYYLLTTPSEEETKEISIKDLKVGDKLHISIKVSADGQLEGTTIAVPLSEIK